MAEAQVVETYETTPSELYGVYVRLAKSMLPTDVLKELIDITASEVEKHADGALGVRFYYVPAKENRPPFIILALYAPKINMDATELLELKKKLEEWALKHFGTARVINTVQLKKRELIGDDDNVQFTWEVVHSV